MSASGKERLSGGITEPGNVRAPSGSLLCSSIREVGLCKCNRTTQRQLEPCSLISIPAQPLINLDALDKVLISFKRQFPHQQKENAIVVTS